VWHVHFDKSVEETLVAGRELRISGRTSYANDPDSEDAWWRWLFEPAADHDSDVLHAAFETQMFQDYGASEQIHDGTIRVTADDEGTLRLAVDLEIEWGDTPVSIDGEFAY
jgi:hypothetical protein